MRTAVVALVMAVVVSSTAWAQGGRRNQRETGPKVGEDAPNFEAKVIGEDETIELKELVKEEKKPVVLIFGSYT